MERSHGPATMSTWERHMATKARKARAKPKRSRAGYVQVQLDADQRRKLEELTMVLELRLCVSLGLAGTFRYLLARAGAQDIHAHLDRAEE